MARTETLQDGSRVVVADRKISRFGITDSAFLISAFPSSAFMGLAGANLGRQPIRNTRAFLWRVVWPKWYALMGLITSDGRSTL